MLIKNCIICESKITLLFEVSNSVWNLLQDAISDEPCAQNDVCFVCFDNLAEQENIHYNLTNLQVVRWFDVPR